MDRRNAKNESRESLNKQRNRRKDMNLSRDSSSSVSNGENRIDSSKNTPKTKSLKVRVLMNGKATTIFKNSTEIEEDNSTEIAQETQECDVDNADSFRRFKRDNNEIDDCISFIYTNRRSSTPEILNGTNSVKDTNDKSIRENFAANTNNVARWGLDPRYRGIHDNLWKAYHAPLFYDWLFSKKLAWPSECAQWGPTSDGDFLNHSLHRVYFSERTGDDERAPNTLLGYSLKVPYPNYSRTNEAARQISFDPTKNYLPSADYKNMVRIIHPGEINKIRCPRSDILLTTSEIPEIFLWVPEKQPFRKDYQKTEASIPDLILKGHEDRADYSLKASCTDDDNVVVASGGHDKKVLVWSVRDHDLGSAKTEQQSLNEASKAAKSTGQLWCSNEFVGHENAIADVSFCPLDHRILASVADDRCLMTWDSRCKKPTFLLKNAHIDDVTCLDWNRFDTNILLTGGNDSLVRIWDRRMWSSTSDSRGSIRFSKEFKEHNGSIYSVQWHPQKKDVLGSCGSDRELIIWDISRQDEGTHHIGNIHINPCVLFRHKLHSLGEVVDFQWCPVSNDPWSICSLSFDSEDGGGSTLQVWRLLDLIYETRDYCLSELDALLK